MVIDTSALLAIYLNEVEKDAFLDAILRDPSSKISAANYVELFLKVDHGANEISRAAFEDFLEGLGLEVVAVTAEQAKLATQANRLYGRSSGHAAKLNFGDCFAYALAKVLDEPLFFKGNDFGQTDVRVATAASLPE